MVTQPISQKKTSKWVHLPHMIRVKQNIFIRVETTYHVDRDYTEVLYYNSL